MGDSRPISLQKSVAFCAYFVTLTSKNVQAASLFVVVLAGSLRTLSLLSVGFVSRLFIKLALTTARVRLFVREL